jgi:hypothetical protein
MAQSELWVPLDNTYSILQQSFLELGNEMGI